MKKRSYPQNKTAQNVKRERDSIPWRYCLLTLICGLLLVGGFFFAAKQHFAAIEYGIKNSRLKKQLDDLGDEKRRLMLDKELAVSPAELTKAAKKLGLTAISASANFVRGNSPAAKIGNASNDATKTVAEAKDAPPVAAKSKTDSAAKDDKPAKDDKVAKESKKADKPNSRANDKKGNDLK